MTGDRLRSFPLVLVCDPAGRETSPLSEALREDGPSLRVLRSPAETPVRGFPALAVVELGNSSEEQDAALKWIAALRKNNCSVVATGCGSRFWPLAKKCRTLLAGACKIFDPEAAGFLGDFREEVRARVREIASRSEDETRVRSALEAHGIVAVSRAMLAVGLLVLRASQLSALPVLLEGETGTGKELLARAIHALDPKRSRRPLVALNCAAVSRELAEAELFGHRRGAFTGAEHDRKGLFRSADGGVLFLDEIAELELELQAKLLRVLQENRLLALGEDRETSIDVRVIAATNQDLRERVARGLFRADLYQRLNVIAIRAPSLRERPDDVPALVAYFLAKYRALNPACPRSAATEFIEALEATELPGNVRQLENILRQAIAAKRDSAPFGLSDLPPELWEELARTAPPQESVPPREASSFPLRLLEEHDWNLPRSMKHFEHMLVELALLRTHGNQSETARLLGITPRSIYNKRRQPAN